MEKQSEALRLADALDIEFQPGNTISEHDVRQSAAELRRLHAENEAHRAFCGQIYTALGTSEADRTKWPDEIRHLHAVNAMLLEALDRLYDAAEGFSVSGVYFNEEHWGKECLSKAAAAIAAARRNI